ncbi:hypothetical protein [Rhodopseudomonas sp. P2A-2r]|uniref:hypothetical protein n=1 Tax=unclassified Rhodopseudomonas TaxID=2638247 RepID=UPI0022344DF0|nr:hypothetical protein [Rhodopseudomonas sp. P2A-2r]UZE47338.1 hypothetical protein ONR75_20560 [Rhodopseudomonas sp. P2A-2r]
MLDKAPNGNVTALLSTLDSALTAGDIALAVDAACVPATIARSDRRPAVVAQSAMLQENSCSI